MKTLIFIFSIVLSSVIQSDATKEETVTWLKSRLDYHAQWGEKHYHDLKMVKYDYKNDTLYYKVHYIFANEPNKAYRIDAIPVRDINPERLRIVRMIGDDGDMAIEIYINYGKESVISTIMDEKGKVKLRSKYNQVSFYFPKWVLETQGMEVIERSEKAIIYLVKLSGGKGEKF